MFLFYFSIVQKNPTAAKAIAPVATHPTTRNAFPVRVNPPMIFRFENSNITITITGTAATPLITAAQTSAFIGLIGESTTPTAKSVDNAITA
jgi:hypothetical protein